MFAHIITSIIAFEWRFCTNISSTVSLAFIAMNAINVNYYEKHQDEILAYNVRTILDIKYEESFRNVLRVIED